MMLWGYWVETKACTRILYSISSAFPPHCDYSTSVIDICLSLQNFVVFAPPAKAFLLIPSGERASGGSWYETR